MKKSALLFVLLTVLSFNAFAQTSETPAVELFTGVSYRHVEAGKAIGGKHLTGWNAAATINFNKWFGVTADVAGHYGSSQDAVSQTSGRQHTFMLGPRVTFRNDSRLTPFAHALTGVELRRFLQVRTDNLTETRSFVEKNTGLAFAAGGGFDWKVADKFGWRIVQADYVRTPTQGAGVHNLRLSFGPVFKFGRK